MKHFKCKQYFTFSPSILFFFKYFGCKFKTLKHIKKLRPPNFKIETSMGSFCFVLGCSNLIQNFSPAKFLKFKFLPLVKDYPGEKYPILSDRYVMLVWVAFLAKKCSLKPGIKVGLKGQSCVILCIILSFNFLFNQFLKKKNCKTRFFQNFTGCSYISISRDNNP